MSAYLDDDDDDDMMMLGMSDEETGAIPSSSFHSNSSSSAPRPVSPDFSHASSTSTASASVVSTTSSRAERERDRPWRTKKDKDGGKKIGARDVERRLKESASCDTMDSSLNASSMASASGIDAFDELSDSEMEERFNASAKRRESWQMDAPEPASSSSSSSRHARVISPVGEIDYDYDKPASKSSSRPSLGDTSRVRPSIGDRQPSSSAILGKVKSKRNLMASTSNPLTSPSATNGTGGLGACTTTPVATSGSDRWDQFDTPDLPHQTARANARAIASAAESAAIRDSNHHTGSTMVLDVEPTQPTPTRASMRSDHTKRNSRPGMLTRSISKGATSLRNLIAGALEDDEEEEDDEPAGFTSPGGNNGMNPHAAVRLQALQMLQLAGGPDSDDGSLLEKLEEPMAPTEVRRTRTGGFSTTPAGGIRVQEDPLPESSVSPVGLHEPAELAGLDMCLSYADAGGSPEGIGESEHFHSSDPRFAIDEDDEADRVARGVASPPLSPGADNNGLSDYGIESIKKMHEAPFEEEDNLDAQARSKYAPSQLDGGEKGSWSSRYSVDRHLMFLNGGQKSYDMEDDVDYAHRSRDSGRSATGMYKASAYNSKSLGSAAMNASNQKDSTKRNTVWMDVDLSSRSSLPPPPHQRHSKGGNNLITNEILHKRRKRLCIGGTVLVALAAIIGSLYGTKIWETAPSEEDWEANHWNVGEKVTFMVTSDVPYNEADEEKLGRELTSLPGDAEFVVHLGDVGLASTSSCVESVYEDASSILKTSRKPVFILPGNNDWNDCPDPDAAFLHWMTYFGEFEDNFSHNFEVTRQLGREENFAFLRNGVLFIGLNLVNGNVPDRTEWELRHQGNVRWTEENLDKLSTEEYRAVVILGHARPSILMDDYFWPVVDDMNEANKPVLYVHANDKKGWEMYQPFTNARLMKAVELDKGGSAPPVKVTVEFGDDPFGFDRRY